MLLRLKCQEVLVGTCTSCFLIDEQRDSTFACSIFFFSLALAALEVISTQLCLVSAIVMCIEAKLEKDGLEGQACQHSPPFSQRRSGTLLVRANTLEAQREERAEPAKRK